MDNKRLRVCKKMATIFMLFFVSTMVWGCTDLLPDEGFTVDFIVDGQIFHQIEVDEITTIQFPNDPIKENYIFAGWYLDEDIWQIRIAPNFIVSESITAYARWEEETPEEQFTIWFDSNGGTEVDSVKGIQGSEVAKPLDPNKHGFTFVGWFDNAELTGKAINFPYTITNNCTFYAKYDFNDDRYVLATDDDFTGLSIYTIYKTMPVRWYNYANYSNLIIYLYGEWHYDQNGNPIPNNKN